MLSTKLDALERLKTKHLVFFCFVFKKVFKILNFKLLTTKHLTQGS